MYKLEFLPIAKRDIESIIYYVSNTLKNNTAARKLATSFIDSANNILQFPYGCPIYEPLKKLENKYRHIRIKNFLMFYTIDEKNKIITIVRIIYQKTDIQNILIIK